MVNFQLSNMKLTDNTENLSRHLMSIRQRYLMQILNENTIMSIEYELKMVNELYKDLLRDKKYTITSIDNKMGIIVGLVNREDPIEPTKFGDGFL